MAPRFDLLVVGDANPDLIVRGDVTPEFGQAEKLVDQADLVIGGSGAIAACGAARLGLRVALRSDEVVRSESIPADVVDTTGAGDSFDAGFLAGRLAGLPLSRSLQLAVACGSLSTRAAGGTAAQPTMDEAVSALESVA